jgi:cell division septation protein DedD
LQDFLKERLMGAAILVVVVVLLVPEMFRGRPAGGAEYGVAGTEGAPVRTYNIDLRDSPAALPPAVAAQPAGSGASAAREAAGAGTPTPNAAPSAAPIAPVTAPVTAPADAPAIEAPAPAPAAVPRPTAGSASGWTVQVGSFTRRDFAERMVKQVRSRGFAVQAVGPDDRGLYRVRSAPMAERAAALALKQKMQARGLKPIVNAAP